MPPVNILNNNYTAFIGVTKEKHDENRAYR